MAPLKLSPKTGSNTKGVPSKRGFSGILPNLPTQISERLLANAKPQSLAEREVLFEAGDDADGCYRLERGLLKVSIASPQGDERILTILGPGSIVGELAIIDGLPRSATVVAIRDCKLSFVSREAFLNCLREYPEIYRDLVSTLCRACARPMRRWRRQISSPSKRASRARCSSLRSISAA